MCPREWHNEWMKGEVFAYVMSSNCINSINCVAEHTVIFWWRYSYLQFCTLHRMSLQVDYLLPWWVSWPNLQGLHPSRHLSPPSISSSLSQRTSRSCVPALWQPFCNLLLSDCDVESDFALITGQWIARMHPLGLLWRLNMETVSTKHSAHNRN